MLMIEGGAIPPDSALDTHYAQPNTTPKEIHESIRFRKYAFWIIITLGYSIILLILGLWSLPVTRLVVGGGDFSVATFTLILLTLGFCGPTLTFVGMLQLLLS